LWNLIQELLLDPEITFDVAVEQLMTRNVTSPGYVIVGGVSGNEGVVIARDSVGTNHTQWLTDGTWFVAQTNRDVWRDHGDARYNATIRNIEALG